MKTNSTEKKGVSQISGSNARPGVVEALRPNAGITKKQSDSKQTLYGSDADATRLIPAVSHEQITERAKALWTQHGCVAGQDQADWYEAEAQLRTES